MTSKLDFEFVTVPAGEFIMGTNPTTYRAAGADEIPQHMLVLPEFHIMRFAVTNAQFQAFVAATGHKSVPLTWRKGYPAEQGDHPVAGVAYHDAIAFCRWAREVTGLPLRLPTEAEWEKAARGTDGRMYPWGDVWDASRCNNREGKSRGTSTVTRYSPAGDSPYGMADAAGNVQDWCSSLFGAYPYDPQDGREAFVQRLDLERVLPVQHEKGAIANAERAEANEGKQVLRGGSWRGDRNEARCAYRSWAAPLHRSDDTGFRCAY